MSLPGGPRIPTEDNSLVTTRVHWAVNRLKEKFPNSIDYDTLLSYCWTGQVATPARTTFWDFWVKNRHDKIAYDKASNSFRFRPPHDISTPDELVKFLQTQPTANGIQVKDLKEGWPDVEAAINLLEADRKVLVHRHRKDQTPRIVWADNPELYAPLDPEFLSMWSKIPLPPPEDVIKELARIGYRPAGTVKDNRKLAQPTGPKKVKRSGRQKITNTHIAHKFRDFSSKRATAQK